jgi:predicted RND superfamily exporter protein
MNIRHSIEKLFEDWSKLVVRHPWWILMITLAFSCAVIPQIRHGWVDVSIESFLPQHAPAMVDYNAFRTDFSYAPGAMLVVETADGAFTPENLKKIQALHAYIEENVPHLEKVTSLANVRYSRSEDDTLEVGDLSEIWPETDADIPAFRNIVLNNPNYQGSIISKNEKILSLFIEPHAFSSKAKTEGANDSVYLSDDEEVEFSQAILDLVDKFNSEGFIVRSAGGPTMNLAITKDMEKSTGKSTLLGMIIIIILLTLLFRR